MGRSNEEMATAAGRIAHFEGKNRFFSVGLSCRFIQYGIKSRIQQALDETCRGVVTPGGLALVATCGGQIESRRVDVELGVQL